MKISIVINARVNSSRIHHKLIRNFCNTTLLDISVEKLSKIKNIEHKYIATCEEQIINICSKYDDIEILPRNQTSVIKGEKPHHIAFDHFKKVKSDFIMIMNPCLPFTTIEMYQKAIKYFQNHQCLSMTSVAKENNIFFDHKFKPINLINKQVVSTKSVKDIYKMAHAFHIINKNIFLQNKQLWTYTKNDPYYFEISKKESLDIDDQLDFDICSSLYNNL